jgi:hypothetical protein
MANRKAPQRFSAEVVSVRFLERVVESQLTSARRSSGCWPRERRAGAPGR